MQFKNLILLVAAAAGVSAVSGQTTTSAFGVLSIRSGSELQYAGWSATSGGLFNLLDSQGARCEGNKTEKYATFSLVNGALYLYSLSAPQQYFWVDRSYTGQGAVGFTLDTDSAPRNAERNGWSITANHLKFDGIGFLACPSYGDGAYSIWLAVSERPANNPHCVGVNAYTVNITDPVSCLYRGL